MSDYVLTYTSDRKGQGGQHTNGPEYGLVRVEHPVSQTAVEVHTYDARGQYKARELALTLCQMAVAELRLAKPDAPAADGERG